ncbi:MAG: hypothetical protein ABUL48_00830 [Pseudorhodoplanes sp.]
MARLDIAELDMATMGTAPANADAFYDLGMMYSIGRSVPADYVVAHKWFNIAAMKGKKDAVRLRQEIAANMSPREIAEAQRAARAWLTSH